MPARSADDIIAHFYKKERARIHRNHAISVRFFVIFIFPLYFFFRNMIRFSYERIVQYFDMMNR